MPRRRDQPPRRRSEVLRTLKEAAGPLSIVELAGRLGVHPNTVRFHLDTLVANGQAERVERAQRGPGRPRQLFQVTTGMDPTGPRQYQLLAEALAESLAADADPAGRALEAGRTWGRRQHSRTQHDGHEPDQPVQPVGRLVTLLDELGFAPEQRAGDQPAPEQPASGIQAPAGAAQIHLRNCPFLELARQRPHIACPIHLGLMQGAMQTWQAPVTVERLEAFAEPDRCIAHLGTMPTLGE